MIYIYARYIHIHTRCIYMYMPTHSHTYIYIYIHTRSTYVSIKLTKPARGETKTKIAQKITKRNKKTEREAQQGAKY